MTIKVKFNVFLIPQKCNLRLKKDVERIDREVKQLMESEGMSSIHLNEWCLLCKEPTVPQPLTQTCLKLTVERI